VALRSVGCLGGERDGPHLSLAILAADSMNVLGAKFADNDLRMGRQEYLRRCSYAARISSVIINGWLQQVFEQPGDAMRLETVLDFVDQGDVRAASVVLKGRDNQPR
jgi:hypothetical protein